MWHEEGGGGISKNESSEKNSRPSLKKRYDTCGSNLYIFLIEKSTL